MIGGLITAIGTAYKFGLWKSSIEDRVVALDKQMRDLMPPAVLAWRAQIGDKVVNIEAEVDSLKDLSRQVPVLVERLGFVAADLKDIKQALSSWIPTLVTKTECALRHKE